MGTTELRKEDLIAMLQSISSQLDQLEKSIETIIPQKHIEWGKEQSTTIEGCEKLLDVLEREILVIEEKEAEHSKSALKISRSFRQESLTF